MTVGWLLLHGTPLGPSVWDAVRGHLGDDVPVWTPDVTPTVDDPTPQRMLATHLADRLERPTHVVGHSFGGQIALELALVAPDALASLTILCARASPFPAFVEHAARVRSGADVTQATLDRWFTAAEVAEDGPVVRAARSALEAVDPDLYGTAIEAIAHFDRVAAARAVRVPTTVVAAELDAGSPPAAMRELADAIAGAALEIVPGAGHMSPFLDPSALAALVLRSASRAGGSRADGSRAGG